MLFIDESQVSFLEDMMGSRAILDTQADGGRLPAPALQRPDLVAQWCTSYLMGERPPMIDLMAWNADATRMPYRMHSEYLASPVPRQ